MNTSDKIVDAGAASAAHRNAPDAGSNDIDAAAEGLADSIADSMFRSTANGDGSRRRCRFPQWPRRRARFEPAKPRDGPLDEVDDDKAPVFGKA